MRKLWMIGGALLTILFVIAVLTAPERRYTPPAATAAEPDPLAGMREKAARDVEIERMAAQLDHVHSALQEEARARK